MVWTIPDLFPNWGDSGEQPPSGKDYQGGDNVNEKHLDYLWNSLYELEDDVRSALEDIDSDKDGVVDKAEKATNVETGFTYIDDSVTFNESGVDVTTFRTKVTNGHVELVDEVKTSDLGYYSNDFSFGQSGGKFYVAKGIESTNGNEIEQFSIPRFYNVLERSSDGTVTISDPSNVNTIDWSNDGESFYIVDEDSIYEYTLSSSNSFDLVGGSPTLATEVDLSAEISTEEDYKDVAFNSDGTKFYILDQNDTIYEYSVGTGYDFNNSTVSYTGNKFDSGSQTEGYVECIEWGDNGNKLYLLDNRVGNYKVLYQYSLATPYDLSSSKTFDKLAGIGENNDTTNNIYFHPDGDRFLFSDNATGSTKIVEYGATTNWDIETLNTQAVDGNVVIKWSATEPDNLNSWETVSYQKTPDDPYGTITVNVLDRFLNTLVSDIGRNEDISSVGSDKNVLIEAKISRNDTAGNPTLDFVGRKYSR